MVNVTSPDPSLSCQRPVSRGRRRRVTAVAAALAMLVVVQFSCRSTRDSWQPYQRPAEGLAAEIREASAVRDAAGNFTADGTCVDCHDGCDESAPGRPPGFVRALPRR